MTQPTTATVNGDPVLLVHSSGLSGRQWKWLADAITDSGRRPLAPDLVGYGENGPLAVDARFDWLEDVARIEARLVSTGAAHLVGHSYGGLIAVTVARRQPALVRSLSLFDPVAFGVLYDADDRTGLADLKGVDDPAFRDEALAGDPRWLERFVDYWNGAGAWRALSDNARQTFLRVGRKVFYEVTTLLDDRAPGAAYAVIEAPTLLMTGERSPTAARQVVAILAKNLPHARVVTVPGCGHMGPLTHPEEVNRLILGNMC